MWRYKLRILATLLAVVTVVVVVYVLLAMPYSRLVAAGARQVVPLVESPNRTLNIYMEQDRRPEISSRKVVATFYSGFRLQGMKLSIYSIHCNIILTLTMILIGIRASLWRRMRFAGGGLAVLYASHVGLLVFAIEMAHLQHRSTTDVADDSSFLWARLGQLDALMALMIPVSIWLFFRSRTVRN